MWNVQTKGLFPYVLHPGMQKVRKQQPIAKYASSTTGLGDILVIGTQDFKVPYVSLSTSSYHTGLSMDLEPVLVYYF